MAVYFIFGIKILYSLCYYTSVYFYTISEANKVNFKRIMAGVLMVMMVPGFTLFSAMATAGDKPAKKQNRSDFASHKEYVDTLEKTYYKGNLGATYTKEQTTFKLWSPLATDVKVRIYQTGTDNEKGAKLISETPMKLVQQYGTWRLDLKGDFVNKYYTYVVTVNGQTNEVVDPYAKACGANGNRGMIVDLTRTNPDGWENDKFTRVSSPVDAVIWEISVRDFSASESSGVTEKNRGKFLAFTENGTVVDSVEGSLPTCVDYLRQLGVNYVQINPFYDFQSIDETADLSNQYNWGYDPKNYNVPEGSYSSNPYDGNVRIKECKQMIQALHEAGIGVIMDVVYNHTYLSKDSWFNLIVPEYYYRFNSDGSWSNGSGCGNDTASERIMFREYMKNSVVYWAEEYHIDGFRFDLMGLHDVETMNYIRHSLDELEDGKKILMYGEAWDLKTACDPDIPLATQKNISKLDRIAAFNDTFRDAAKGDTFNKKDQGFIQSGKGMTRVKLGIEGMSGITAWDTSVTKCVNYVSCHDNLSLYDKLYISMYDGRGNFRVRREDLVQVNKLGAALTLTSQGIPFMLAGEEFARSKDGDENSYKSPIAVNQIDWNNLNKFADLNEYYKGLIDIRKTVDILTDGTGTAEKTIKYIEADEKVLAYTMKGKNNTKSFAAIFNASDKETTVTLPSGYAQTWVRMADENRAGIINLGEITDNKVTVKPHSCAILVNKTSFDAYKDIDTSYHVVAKYIDSSSNEVVYEKILKGDITTNYDLTHPNVLMYHHRVKSTQGELAGVFEHPYKEVFIYIEPYDGEHSSVTIHFVDENGKNIADSIVMSNKIGQRYNTPYLASVEGYSLDLKRLPTNGAGKYQKDPITVTYTYKTAQALSQPADPGVAPQGVANIVYMGSDGKILSVVTVKGDVETPVVFENPKFKGYKYESDSSTGAMFGTAETNIIVQYKKISVLLIVLIATGGVLVVGAVVAGVVVYVKRKPQRVYASKVGDDLYIEE